MAHMGLSIGIAKDLQSVTITLFQDGVPLGHIIYDASALDAVIRQFAKCRQQLAEEVTPTLDPGSRLEVEREPAWVVDQKPGPHSHEMVLALRHRGLGWLGFVLEPDRALALSEKLAAASKPQQDIPS